MQIYWISHGTRKLTVVQYLIWLFCGHVQSQFLSHSHFVVFYCYLDWLFSCFIDLPAFLWSQSLLIRNSGRFKRKRKSNDPLSSGTTKPYELCEVNILNVCMLLKKLRIVLYVNTATIKLPNEYIQRFSLMFDFLSVFICATVFTWFYCVFLLLHQVLRWNSQYNYTYLYTYNYTFELQE